MNEASRCGGNGEAGISRTRLNSMDLKTELLYENVLKYPDIIIYRCVRNDHVCKTCFMFEIEIF